MNQSQLARMAGVSRQIVSHWFQVEETFVNVQSKNLKAIADSLHLNMGDLSRSFSVLDVQSERSALTTNLLWDCLYPDLETFISALIRGQLPALARIVQVCGLFQSEQIVGRVVWDKFPAFKLKMAPPPTEAG